MNSPPILCYITDRSQLSCPPHLRTERLLQAIRAACAAGVDWVQVREKQMAARELCRLVEAAAALPERGQVRLVVNGRVDVALSCGAAGVHLPADSPPVGAVRRIVPPGFVIGVSCHSAAEAAAAARDGADYVLLGPVFATPGKGPPSGVALLEEARRLIPPAFPILALGGITLQNASQCLEAGASGVAAIRLFQSPDVAASVSALRSLTIRGSFGPHS
jgi:thiamine-phosphate pyrophosphorylase